MHFKKLVLVALIASTPLVVSAQDQEEKAKTPDNILADCGIGGALFKDDTLGVISNIIWDIGTTAVTSGLSSPETCAGQEVAVAEFITETYSSIADETVKGEGAYLTAMLSLAGCSADAQPVVINSVRASFAQDLSNENYAEQSDFEKASSYFNILKDSSAGTCDLG